VKYPLAGLRKVLACCAAASCLWLAGGCAPDMSDQPKYKNLRGSDLFADGRSARPLIEGTVGTGRLRSDEALFTGQANGAPVERIPVPVTRALLERGRERFGIYCTPCHGRLGTGDGMVVLRGFQRPTSYHIDRLREAPDGHFFDVITRGLGAMAGQGARLAPADRWAITAYIRALQLSQRARIEDVPPEERDKLKGQPK
jgi:mono/diheme cytochrome c family protein